jgi:threonine/homoserine/homoserine lactone efflux protein
VLAYLIRGLGYGFTATAQPGPFQAFVITQALDRGWRRALPAALAPLVSDGPVLFLTLVVLQHVPAGFQRVLNVVGGVFLLYLAWGTLRSYVRARHAGRGPSEAASVEDSGGDDGGQSADQEAARGAPPGLGSLWRAALANLLSPGPYLFWSLVTGPVLIEGWRRSPWSGIGFLAGFYGAMIGGLVLLILLFSLAREASDRVRSALVALSGVALAGFGVFQIARGIIG